MQSELWTESEKLNERFKVQSGLYQDLNWMRRLFSPIFFTFGGAIFFGVGLAVSGPAAATFILIGAIWVLGVVGLLIYARYQGKKAKHHRWLFENGLRGSATLVKASSNTAINDQPVVKMVIDVQVPGQAPRRIHHRILMSDFAAYRMRPGVVLPVHVNPDPRKPGDLLVRW